MTFLLYVSSHFARLSTAVQILIFLPLTLATLSTRAFLLLSLLLSIHSLIHGTCIILWPGSKVLSFLQGAFTFADLHLFHNAISLQLQVPMHSFLLLVVFNIFSAPANPWLLTAADAWGKMLAFSGPLFILLEGVSSLLVAQKAGKIAKELVAEGESYQLALLVGTAVAYVSSAWWIVVSYSAAASSPLASTLLGAALCSFFFLSCIGFVLRRTNVVESSGMALFIAYNVWLCGLGSDEKSVFDSALSYAPLLPNIMPHFEALFNFIRHTLPKPVLFALLYRLTILQLASRILPTIGADSFDDTYGVDDTWEDRPTSALTRLLLTYRQSIFVTVYSHLLLLDPSSQVWSRWMLIFFTLVIWGVELLVSSGEDDVGKRLD